MRKPQANEKCIVLARVSTIYQDYTQQVNELRKAAIADGFAEENVIVINDKESATKLSEENRLGLNEMKQAIADDPSITTVYVREVSRIGRRYDVLSSMKAYFVKNQIQLVINGDQRNVLLTDDGDLDFCGNMLFEFACNRAVEEMNDKKIRTRQGRINAQANGGLGCSRPAYGYTIKDKRLAINEEEAEVIRYIFDTYANGKQTSTKTIYRDLRDRGIFEAYPSENTGYKRILKILKNKSYSGRNKKGLQYPPIVSAELQDAAIYKAEHARQGEKATHKHTYYCSGLLFCECGGRMHGNHGYDSYTCSLCGKRIGINQLDHVAWGEAQVIKTLQMKQDRRTTIADAERQLHDNNQRMAAAERRLRELEDAEEDIAKASLTISNKEKRDAFRKRETEAVRVEQKELNNTIAKLTQDNDRLQRILNPSNDKLNEELFLAGISDDKKRKEVINETIESIKVERIDEKRVKFLITPTVAAWGWSVPYVTHYVYDRTKRTHPSLFRVTGEVTEDVTKQIVKRLEKWIVRHQRKQQEAEALKYKEVG